MKRIIGIFIVSVTLLSLAACSFARNGNSGSDNSAVAVSDTDGVSDADTSESVASAADIADSTASDEYAVTDFVCPPEGYITESDVTIESEYITIKIAKGAYVPEHLTEYADSLYLALEEASGLSFLDAPFGRRPVINVELPDRELYPNADKESEMGQAYADDYAVTCTPGDLFISQSYTLAHELSHVLERRQHSAYSGKVLCEGFAEYNCYRALQLLAEKSPETLYALSPMQDSVNNMVIQDDALLLSQQPEYWLENIFTGAPNGSYAVGFRLAAYLLDRYGNYADWMSYTAKESQLSAAQQKDALVKAYGADVLDGFYPWLRQNQHQFDESYNFEYDLTALDRIKLYPSFVAFDKYVSLTGFGEQTVAYSDLEIDLRALRFYLSEYKGYDISGLTLVTDAASVELYGEDGSLINSIEGVERIPLDGVYSIKLKGTKVIGKLEVIGFVKTQ